VPKDDAKSLFPEAILRKPIEELEISTRSFNALNRRGIKTVGEILELTDEQLFRFKNLGRNSLSDIRRALAKLSGVPLKTSLLRKNVGRSLHALEIADDFQGSLGRRC